MDRPTVERLVETASLRTSQLKTQIEYATPSMHYNSDSDILMLMYVPPSVETVVHYIDEHVALLYDPETHQVVGFQIEAFQRSFLPQHTSVESAWKLGDLGQELQDLGDLSAAFNDRKSEIARELVNVTEHLIDPPHTPHPVPA